MKINKEQEEYLEKFYKSTFTPHDFISLFIAGLKARKEHSFDKTLLSDFIYECKKTGKYQEILNDIKFKSNGISNYSEEYEEVITEAKFVGLLYTISPETDDNINISEDTEIIPLLKPRINYFDNMVDFINDFEVYMHELSQKVYKIYMKEEIYGK